MAVYEIFQSVAVDLVAANDIYLPLNYLRERLDQRYDDGGEYGREA
ncbi:MAG: hypothetical protein ACI9S8_001920 [Chlamydiales bacterium]|jgi:hypothetical protein